MNDELALAARLAGRYLEALDQRPVSREPDLATLRSSLGRPLVDEGLAAEEVIRELARDADGGLLDSASGRFFGWVIGGNLPVAVAADWLVSAWDQNIALFACAPAAGVIEEVAEDWLKDLLGLPTAASTAFVTGCQMAHVTALAAARHRLLTDRGWSVETRGLAGAPPLRVVVGEHHETLVRALRLLGIGSDALVRVACGEDGTLSPTALEAELARDPASPTIVSLAAGDLNRGAFDPFDEICPLARAAGAWVHVDGAFGLWAAASPRFRNLVRGIEQAHSWATDAHKWLNVPYDSGVAFVADPEAHRAAMSIAAAYRPDVESAREPADWGPEWSRRARAIPLYAALRHLGRRGVADLVDRCCDLAAELVAGLAALEDVEVLSEPVINQGLVRFLAADGDHDRRTGEVVRRINASGEAYFGATTWQGMRVMRISVCNHRTTRKDVERAVRAVATAMEETA